MRTREDISAKDGRLVLFEYAEEHPLLMSCIGMASRIKNYSKKSLNGDPVSCDHLKYGDQVYNTSPYFLGKLHSGQVLQVLANQRAVLVSRDINQPIRAQYSHHVTQTSQSEHRNHTT